MNNEIFGLQFIILRTGLYFIDHSLWLFSIYYERLTMNHVLTDHDRKK
ncbi:MAG: hypothetical protein JWR09_3922 [Mucilaginibacter sp.]|nr:hypothetical protein [Mucilaginibacter sp.]